jgi:hypothetical protein
VQDWLSDAPETTRRCSHCNYLNRYDTADVVSAQCGNCGHDVSAAWLIGQHHERQAELRELDPRPIRGVVYYLTFRDAVKIGFSENFATRIEAHPHETVLAAEPGDYALERERHKQFSSHLIAGQKEWFKASDEVLEHAMSLRDQYGDPYELADNIARPHATAASIREVEG